MYDRHAPIWFLTVVPHGFGRTIWMLSATFGCCPQHRRWLCRAACLPCRLARLRRGGAANTRLAANSCSVQNCAQRWCSSAHRLTRSSDPCRRKDFPRCYVHQVQLMERCRALEQHRMLLGGVCHGGQSRTLLMGTRFPFCTEQHSKTGSTLPWRQPR